MIPPEKFGGQKVRLVAGGGAQSAAVTEQDRFYWWGFMEKESSLEPKLIPDLCMKRVSKGHIFSTFFFGLTERGREREREETRLTRPAVALGNLHAVALLSNGQIYAWGSNSKGQLGLGNFVDRPTPTPVDSVNSKYQIKNIGVGDQHSIAITCTVSFSLAPSPRGVTARAAQDHIIVWGRNEGGMLGIPGCADQEAIPVPSRIVEPSDQKILDVGAGSKYSVVLYGTLSSSSFLLSPSSSSSFSEKRRKKIVEFSGLADPGMRRRRQGVRMGTGVPPQRGPSPHARGDSSGVQ